MGYLESNRKALQERYPELLEKLMSQNKKTLTIENKDTREDGHALVIYKEGEMFRLNSAYRPLQEAIKWADQYAFQNINVNVFMFGMGNGIFIRELLKSLASDGHLFIVEPSEEIFSFVLEWEDVSEIISDKRLQLYVGDGYDELFKSNAGRVVNWDNLSTQIRCEHPGYKKLLPEEYNHFWDSVDRVNEVVVTQMNTNAFFAHRAVDNVFHNLAYVEKSNYITELMGKIPKELPAVIVSAGPSLDKNIDELRKMKNHALIIATDTAVRILEERQIHYDCIVTVDPGKPAWYLTNYPNCADVPLILCAEAQKEVTAFHTGRKIWMSGSIYLSDIYTKHGFPFPAYTSGGSVATSSFSIAKILGLQNIVLIGQDLAFQGDRTHAGGHEDHIRNEEKGIQMIEGIDGGQVRSRRDWIYYLHWFEEQIQHDPDVNVIDATEGGALIHGSKVMKLSEVVEEYCGVEFSFANFMNELPSTFEINDYEPIKKEIEGLETGFRNIISKSKEGIKYAEEFIEKAYTLSAKRHDRLIKELKKANKFIWRQTGYGLVDMYSSGLAVGDLKNINCITGDPIQDEINSVKSAKVLYEGFVEAAEQMQGLLQVSENVEA